MIKIKKYSELPESNKVFNLYLFIVSMSMPFYPEDIFPDGFFYPDGITKTDLKQFPRSERKRTDKYRHLILDKINQFSVFPSTRKDEDALLAEILIKEYSNDLHSFLYNGKTGGHVNTEALHLLLTTPMDELSIAKNAELYKVFKNIDSSKNSKLILEHVFRYDTFSSREEIHRFISLLGVDVCPYCNRQYTTTALRTAKASPIRAEFDHYRNKSNYPFFALSILNLVPCCSVCNRTKKDKIQDFLYPYVEGIDQDYVFRTSPKNGIIYLTGTRIMKEDFVLSFKEKNSVMDTSKRKRVLNSIKNLQLDTLYNAHREYVSDIIFQRYIFTEPMIQELMQQFPDLFHSREEVRNMLVLLDMNEKNWGKRPLSKLTHDISEELDELYAPVGL